MDPFFSSTLLHFSDLLKRYGGPVSILNLVRAREKRPRETILKNTLDGAMEFIHTISTFSNAELPIQLGNDPATATTTHSRSRKDVAKDKAGKEASSVQESAKKTQEGYTVPKMDAYPTRLINYIPWDFKIAAKCEFSLSSDKKSNHVGISSNFS